MIAEDQLCSSHASLGLVETAELTLSNLEASACSLLT